MNNNLIFQVDIKGFDFSKTDFWRPYTRHEKLYADSKQSAIEYARKVNADYFCLSKPMIPGGLAPNHQKLSFYYFFEKFDYDKIFLLDCDAIIQKECPNIFEYDKVSGVTNIPQENSEEWPAMKKKFNLYPDTTPSFLNQLEHHDIPPDYKSYFCSGIVMFTRDFYEATKNYWMDELLYRNTRNNVGYHDQTVLNCLAYKYFTHDNINILDDRWGAWWKDSEFINHISGERRDNYL